MKNANNTTQKSATITPENAIEHGCKIAIVALKTVANSSGSPFVRKMYADAVTTAGIYLCGFDAVKAGYIADRGADIVGEAILETEKHNGENLDEKDDNGTTLFVRIIRKIHQKIRNERHENKTQHLYTQNPENGFEVMIPKNWTIENWAEYTEIADTIAKLELTENQKNILAQRLGGRGNKAIAKSNGTTYQAIQNTLAKIGAKYEKAVAPVTEHAKTLACRSLQKTENPKKVARDEKARKAREKAFAKGNPEKATVSGDLLKWTRIDDIYKTMQANKRKQ